MARINFEVNDQEALQIKSQAAASGCGSVAQYLRELIKRDGRNEAFDKQVAQKPIPALPSPRDIGGLVNSSEKRRRIAIEAMESLKANKGVTEPTIEELRKAVETLYGEYGITGGLAEYVVKEGWMDLHGVKT